MYKFVSAAAMVGLLVLTVSQEASAGWRRRCRTVWYPPVAAAVPAPAASAPVVNSPAMARSGNGATYRSYSYDAGPAYRAAPGYSYSQPTLEPSQSRFFRADRKAHGLSWYRNQ